MNTHKLREQHETAIEKLININYQQILIDNLTESIKGIGGQFPENRKEWEKALEKAEAKIVDLKVEYRMFLNSIR